MRRRALSAFVPFRRRSAAPAPGPMDSNPCLKELTMTLSAIHRRPGPLAAAAVLLTVAAGLYAMAGPSAAESAPSCPTAAAAAADAVARARACGSRVEV